MTVYNTNRLASGATIQSSVLTICQNDLVLFNSLIENLPKRFFFLEVICFFICPCLITILFLFIQGMERWTGLYFVFFL